MQDSYETKHLTLQAEVTLLDQEVANGATDLNLAQIIDSSIRDSEKKLHSAKMVLRFIYLLRRSCIQDEILELSLVLSK